MRYWNIFFSFILDPPQIVPFSFGVETVNKGDYAQLMCVVMRGDEPLDLSWSLKGDIISSDLGLSTTMLGKRTSMLTIAEVNYRHTGTYTCRATNPAGSVTHSASLTVNGNVKIGRCWNLNSCYILEPPEIVPFAFGSSTVNTGEFAQIFCVVGKGDEPITLSWSLKGDIVTSDPVLSTTMLGSRTSMLTISAVNYRHTGTYTCRASNPAGSVSHSADLVVDGNY